MIKDLKKMKKHRTQRPSISVSGKIYDRLRAAFPAGNVATFVDEIVEAALNDPLITARLIDKCRQEDVLS